MIIPESKSIENILSKTGTKYSVPIYQRNFDWGRSELQELIDDLKDSVKSGRELFLGNFIFDISENSASQINEYKIVDGQQRLTTLSIILVALRENAKKLNEHRLAGDVQRLIDNDSSIRQGQGRKIIVSENVRDIFNYISDFEWDGNFVDKIDAKPVKRQVNKLRPIYDYVNKELGTYDADSLHAFWRSLVRSYVIVINVQSDEDVFAIFERTNARGLDLNIGDLLKNYIFSHGTEEFENKWSDIISNAGGSLQRMLKYFWISRKGHIQGVDLYKSLRAYGNDLGIQQFVDELYAFSQYYAVTQSSSTEELVVWLNEAGLQDLAKHQDSYERIARVFDALRLFRITQAYPLIFSIFKFYKTDNTSSRKNLLVLLESIEKYHFVNNVIADRIGNEVEKFYAEKAEHYFSGECDFNREVDEIINELYAKCASKDEFVARFADSLAYGSKNTGLINYFYDRLNNFGVDGGQRIKIYNSDKNVQRKLYSIEHFLPQSYKKTINNPEDIESIDAIGNLLVIPYHSNSAFGDRSPKKKSEMLIKDSKYKGGLRYIDDFLDEYKHSFDTWSSQDIKHRSLKMAELSYKKVWSLKEGRQ